MPVAGQVKIILAADAASYSAALDKAKAQLKQFEGSAKSAGSTARQEFSEARGSIMVLGEEVGVHLPRHVQAFVASLPGVSKAMSAAFDTIAVVAIADAVVKAGEKLKDFIEKNEQLAQKNRELWSSLHGSMEAQNDDLDLTKIKLQNAIAKLEKKPQNSVAEAIAQARVEADKLESTINSVVEKIENALKGEVSGGLAQIFLKQTGGTQTSSIVDTLKLRLSDIEGGYVQGDKTQLEQSAIQSALDQLAPIVKTSHDTVEELKRNHAPLEHSAARVEYEASSQTAEDLRSLLRQLTTSGEIAGLQPKLAKLTAAQGATPADTPWAGYGNPALYAAARATLMPSRVGSVMSPIGPVRAPMWNDRPITSMEAWRSSLVNALPPESTVGTLGMAMSVDPAVARQAAQTAENLTKLLGEKLPQILGPVETPFQQLGDTVRQVVQDFTNLGNILSENFTRDLNSFNDTLMHVLETPSNRMRGQHPWRNMGAGMAETAGRSALQYGEGSLMKALGLGGTGKADGSQSKPFYVRLAEGLTGSSSATSGIMAWLNNSNWAGNLFGGRLFGSGGIFDTAAGSGASAASGEAAQGIGQLFSALLPTMGFAEGGMIPSNMPVLVGERGPEILAGAGGRSVIPNNRLSLGAGDTHFYSIDARGATDPAAIEAAVNRAMASYAPTAQRMAMASIQDHNRRVPPSKRM